MSSFRDGLDDDVSVARSAKLVVPLRDRESGLLFGVIGPSSNLASDFSMP